MTAANDGDIRENAQVERLAASAAELGRAIRRANALPPGFPESELLALADALGDAPSADFEARLEAGLYIRERLIEVRRGFVSETSDDPDIPGVDAIAHCLNDTIAELSTLVVTAGKEAENHARPDRAGATSIVATEAAGEDATEVQRTADRATKDIQQLEATLQSASGNLHIDQSRHYHFLNLAISIERLKLPVKIVGAIFKAEWLDRSWLDKVMARLEELRASFLNAWEDFLSLGRRIDSIIDAVQRVSRNLADLSGLVRQVMQRLFQEERTTPLQPGNIFRDIYEQRCPELVLIPSGEYVMGSNAAEQDWAVAQGASSRWVQVEQPQHQVRIDVLLAVGRYPVTFEEYDHFADASGREKPRDEGWGRYRRPVINVSWDDAKAYVEWLRAETGQPYRLLSEAEWEYVARAGTRSWRWWGNDITAENTNFRENVGRTSEVGTYPMNPWALYEMIGNVWEWCEDCWNDSYADAPSSGDAWKNGDCNLRIIRGGSWKSKPGIVRAAYRNRAETRHRENNIGFRVVRTLGT
jgi:formylglycine-generating enzyme required for sulfatase activity